MAQKIGRSSTIFWSLILSMACCIWSAIMTKSSQYELFIVASLFRGLFGGTPAIVGTRLLLDMFFLHQRGKAFAVFTFMFLLGVLAGPTFSGFIVQHVKWPIQFWWGVASQGVTAVLVFIFLEETGWTRDGKTQYPKPPESWLQNRIATFLPGVQVVPPISVSQLVSSGLSKSRIIADFSLKGLVRSIPIPHWSQPDHFGGRCVLDDHLRMVRHNQYSSYSLFRKSSYRRRLWFHTTTECCMYVHDI